MGMTKRVGSGNSTPRPATTSRKIGNDLPEQQYDNGAGNGQDADRVHHGD